VTNIFKVKRNQLKINQMNKKVSILLGAALILVGSTVNAQFQLSANGSYLKGTGDNTSHLWGGGISAKYLLGHTVAVGVGFNSFPKTTSSESVGSTTFSSANTNTQVFGNIDFMLGGSTSIFQPYIGANVGASINSHSYAYGTSTSLSTYTSNDKTFFYVAPLVGFNVGFAKNFGVFAQGSYGLNFGDSNNSNSTVTVPSSTSKPVDKFFQVDAGIYVRL
jgi:hypothetical protein